MHGPAPSCCKAHVAPERSRRTGRGATDNVVVAWATKLVGSRQRCALAYKHKHKPARPHALLDGATGQGGGIRAEHRSDGAVAAAAVCSRARQRRAPGTRTRRATARHCEARKDLASPQPSIANRQRGLSFRCCVASALSGPPFGDEKPARMAVGRISCIAMARLPSYPCPSCSRDASETPSEQVRFLAAAETMQRRSRAGAVRCERDVRLTV